MLIENNCWEKEESDKAKYCYELVQRNAHISRIMNHTITRNSKNICHGH